MDEDVAQLMLGLAKEDAAAASALLPLDGVADSIVGFHCQQAVEKALKSALASREVRFPHTHDLAGLTELCRDSGLGVPQELHGVERLARYGVQMRYGSARGAPLDREQALRWAGAAVEWAAELERARLRERPDSWPSRDEKQDLWPSRSPDDRADR
ncbi:MAG TPA: HEPN domain-containing protein [Solirubrobacteraceae bacterium]|jgi:HEPN domain-containing protein|nr:HEPN domain-containing protein [Solirubrobacteraceae bacterium]